MNTKAKTENEAEIINPDQDLTINGETITVKEFRFKQAMTAAVTAADIVEEMRVLITDKGNDLHLTDIEGLFAKHWDAFIALLSLSTGKDEVYLTELSDMEGQSLMNSFWVVNSGFFMRRLMAAQLRARIQPVEVSATGSSSQH